MRLSVLYTPETEGPDVHVHALGCKDVRRTPGVKHQFEVVAAEKREALRIIWEDELSSEPFDGDMTLWGSLTRFYPCVSWADKPGAKPKRESVVPDRSPTYTLTRINSVERAGQEVTVQFVAWDGNGMECEVTVTATMEKLAKFLLA